MDVNKPLITSILIGEFEQSVSYEGIQKLCFDCGRIGHRKESCPYSIRASAPPLRESLDRSTDPVDETCNSHEGDVANDGKVSTTDG